MAAGRKAMEFGPALRTAATVAGFLLTWQLVVAATGIKPYILPSPASIFAGSDLG